MSRTLKALVEPDGTVRLLEPLSLERSKRALVTILEEGDAQEVSGALLSEPALATDWSRPEEDAAWAHLQQDR